ncbi:MAG: oligopeptide ABC transporter permease [Bacillota bacterium]|jgi:peptide/nickel transport system permease protein
MKGFRNRNHWVSKANKRLKFGILLLTIILLFCFFGPLFSPYELQETNLLEAKQPPSLSHWLGTDGAGRDVLLRLMYGGRISLMVGFFAVALEVMLGTMIGLSAGFYGGVIDNLLMRLVDVVFSIPFLPVLLLTSAVMTELRVLPNLRIYLLVFMIGIFSWPYLARLVRSQVLSLREEEFMLATEVLGLKDSRKIFYHLLPNVLPQVIVTGTLAVATAILAEATLSYLGVGVLPPYPSWGNMVQVVNDFNDFKYRSWLWLPPGGMIFLTVAAINLIGDGLRDALDPKSEERTTSFQKGWRKSAKQLSK